MSSAIRTTRECNVSQLHPRLFQAVQEYFQTHHLGDPDTEIRMCCETVAVKRDLGKMVSFLEGDPDTTSQLALLLTNDWFIWARNGDQSGTVVSGAKLKGLQVKTFVVRRTRNLQLEISGMIGGTRDYVRGNLEMGSELAAQKFCEEVERVVHSVTPPARKSRLRWFGS
jgi:hypothetical protein